MDFRQIEAFVNVVKYKGFSRAAEATFVTQPTISAHVNSLEEELDVKLILRNKNHIELTDFGKLFYKYAITMLNTREQAVYSLKNFSSTINGTVYISCSSIPGQYIMPKLMKDFREEYPDAMFSIHQSDSNRVIEGIKAHRYAIGFTGRRKNDNLTYKPILRDRSVLITPDNEHFREKLGKSFAMEDIVREPMIMREIGSATLDDFEKALMEKGITMPASNIIGRIDNMDVIKKFVSAGLGVSVVSSIAAESSREKENYLIFDIEGYTAVREFYMVWDENFALSPTGEAFKKFVLENEMLKDD